MGQVIDLPENSQDEIPCPPLFLQNPVQLLVEL